MTSDMNQNRNVPVDDAPWVAGSAQIETEDDRLAEARRRLRPLYRYIVRRLEALEGMAGRRVDGVLPLEVLDTVIAESMARRDERPDGMGTLRWFRRLADEVIDRDVRPGLEQPELSLDALLEEHGQERDDLLLPQDLATEQPMLAELTDPSSLSPEEQTVRDEFQTNLIRALGGMPDDLREVFLLHTRDGYSPEEIAELEGIATEEARDQIAYARRHLQEALGREYGEGDDALPATETMYQAIEDVPFEDEYLDRIIGVFGERGMGSGERDSGFGIRGE